MGTGNPGCLSLLGLVISLTILVITIRAADSVAGIFEEGRASSLYFYLRSWIGVVKWSIGLLTLAGALLWLWVGLATHLVVKLVVDVGVGAIVPENPKFGRQKRRFCKVINQSIRRLVIWTSVAIIFLVTVVYIAIGVQDKTAEQAVEILIWIVIVISPVVFGINWFRILRVRRDRRSQIRVSWDNYYLSRQALFDELKGSLQFAITIALIGIFLLPAFGKMLIEIEQVGANIVEAQTDYQASWSEIVTGGYPSDTTIVNSEIDLPAPSNLELYLGWVDELIHNVDGDDLIKRFQEGMFLVVLVVTGLSIGIPTAVSFVVLPERRRLIRSALTTTLTTSVVLAGVAIFFQKAFFQDSGAPIGLGLIVAVMVGFALTLRQLR